MAAIGDGVVIINEGAVIIIGGTSASTPVFASVLTRINEERLLAGKSTVGFVNPTLVCLISKRCIFSATNTNVYSMPTLKFCTISLRVTTTLARAMDSSVASVGILVLFATIEKVDLGFDANATSSDRFGNARLPNDIGSLHESPLGNLRSLYDKEGHE